MAVQSVERAIGLFEQLAFDDVEREGRGLAELARVAGLAPNTTHNLLKTMQKLGYVARNEADRYIAGPRCRDIAMLERWHMESSRQYVEPVLEQLCKEINEGVNFTIMVGGERREVAGVEPDQAVKVDRSRAEKYSIYRLVSTRVLLAGVDQKHLEEYITRHGWPGEDWNGIQDMASLEKALQKIREDGYCVLAPNVPEVASLASLVYNHAGDFFGALGCYLPMFRYSTKVRDNILKKFKAAGRKLSHEL
ncbi:MAG: IclR family transcriptional regulator [Candidatus Sumerlaeia bacterium]